MKKVLTSIKPSIESAVKPKFCARCGDAATQQALFTVDESAIVIERYCD